MEDNTDNKVLTVSRGSNTSDNEDRYRRPERDLQNFNSRSTVALPAETSTLIGDALENDDVPPGRARNRLSETIDFPTGIGLTFDKSYSSGQLQARRLTKTSLIILGGVIAGLCISIGLVVLKDSLTHSESEIAARELVAKRSVPDAGTPEVAPLAARGPAPAPPVSSELFVIPQSDLGPAVEVHQSAIAPDVNIEEYARSLPVEIAPREFLYYSDAQRSVGTSLMKPDLDIRPAASGSVTRRTLEAGGQDGRFKSLNDNTEWQGGFKLNAPTENMAKGQEYAEYVTRQNTSSLDNLKVIRAPGNSLASSAGSLKVQPKR